MTIPWNWLNVSSAVNFLTALILGLFVYLKNRKAAINRAFGLMSLSVAFWAGATYIWSTTDNLAKALFWARFANFSALFIAVLFLHFILELLGQVSQKKTLLRAAYVLNITVFILAILFPMSFVGNMSPKFTFILYTDQPGFLYYIFTFIFFLYVNYTVFSMLKLWKVATGIKRNQVKYMLIATLVGFGGGGSTFLMVYDIPFPPYPNILMSLWTVILAFAIIRYRLMDIETVIHRTILWLLTSSLILIPIGILLYFTRSWLAQLNWIQLTFVTTALFYLYLYYYLKMQPKIDHLFRRRKYDYQTVLGKVAEKIATTISIEDLAQQLLTEVCEAMYLRNSLLYVLAKDEKKYSLIGRRGYKELEGTRQRAALEIYTEEEKVKFSDRQRELGMDNSLCKWLSEHRDILEKELVEVDPQYGEIKQEVLTWLKEQDAEVIVPLVVKDKVNAILGLGKKESLQAYNAKDLQLLKKLGQEAGVTIFNALHYEDLAEKERLEGEMRLGRDIQMNLLPRKTPEIAGLKVTGMMIPAREIGGDYYDYIHTFRQQQGGEENRLGIVIGDVSGKGVAAGLIMATAKATLKGLSQQELTPKQILSQANSVLYEYTNGQKFMTLLYFQYLEKHRTLSYSSAGHEHILIYHADSAQVESIMSGGFMLGMIPDIGHFLEDREIDIKPNDKVILYTDGVTEARNSEEVMFGLSRLATTVSKHGNKSANELLASIKDEVYSFIGSREQYDDITLVVLEAV